MQDDFRVYFEGKKLYGDDFTLKEIESWYSDEQEGYATLAQDKDKYIYEYHGLNQEYGFRFLPNTTFQNILGFGSCYGHEFYPILDKIRNITIIEPSEKFASSDIKGKPVCYVRPTVSGDLLFENDSFDLITCFQVLHHIPNVSKILQEFYRCLKSKGYVLISEPITSMGDWRKPRTGLTKRERGLPLNVFRDIILSTGFTIVKEQRTDHRITRKFKNIYQGYFKKSIYNSIIAMKFDRFFSRYFHINKQYYPFKKYRGPGAAGVFYVLSKSNS